MKQRYLQIAEHIKRILSECIQKDLRDPRISGMVTITKVDLTRDYSLAKVYVSIYESKTSKDETLNALEKAKGFLRKSLANALDMRTTPEIRFIIDQDLDIAVDFNNILNDTIKKDEENRKRREKEERDEFLKSPNLDNYDTILVFPHESPDGDAIGACVAMYYALLQKNKNPIIVSEDEIPKSLKFLTKDFVLKPDELKDIDYEFCISLDVSDLLRLGNRARLIDKDHPLWNIDHHVTNDNFGTFNTVDSTASSACELLYFILKRMDIKITKEIAEALYTGISTDTGSFRYETTATTTHEVVQELLKTGMDHQKVVREIYQNNPLEKLKLEAIAVQNSKSYENGSLMISYLDIDTLSKYDIDNSTTDGIVEKLRNIGGVEISAFLKEEENGTIKVSMRSKFKFDISGFALKQGGGGHARAAGFRYKKTKKTMQEEVEFMAEKIHKAFFSDGVSTYFG